jgi:LacI family transcriptional regulator
VATIKQVAERAQVSSATVSRVLNGDQRVAPDLRTRVLKAARDLKYRRNSVARNLRRRQSETIGVVVSDIENPHFTQSVRSIEDAAYKQGYRVILCNTDETAEKQSAYLEVLAAEQVIGIILAAASPSDPTITAVLDMGIPIVAFDRSVDDQRADAVIGDNIEAARVATDHLVKKAGRRNVGFISGRLEIQTGVDRLKGYQDAMLDLGLPTVLGHGGFRLGSAQQATRDLLADNPLLDGLVIANNLMTIGALKALRTAGKRIPDDVAVVSIDDPPWAALVDPSMTTLGQPVRQMALRAFELLMDQITTQRTAARVVVFSFELCVRHSCGSVESGPAVSNRSVHSVPHP